MKFALWTMNRFAVDPALIGDLTEEWNNRQSVWWLWHQSIVAIASAIWIGLWHHKLRTFAAVAVGWVGWILLFDVVMYTVSPFPNFPVGLLLFVLRPILLGWIVGKLHPTQPMGTSFLYIAVFIVVAMSLGGMDYKAIPLVLWFILTTALGGFFATRKAKCLPVLG